MSIQIKNNEADNSTELWINGEFNTSWLIFELPESIRGRIQSMLYKAYEQGERDRSKEINKLLGN